MREVARALATAAGIATLTGCATPPAAQSLSTLRNNVVFDPTGQPLAPDAELPHKLVDERGRTWIQMPNLAACRGMQVETLLIRGAIYIPETISPHQLR